MNGLRFQGGLQSLQKRSIGGGSSRTGGNLNLSVFPASSSSPDLRNDDDLNDDDEKDDDDDDDDDMSLLDLPTEENSNSNSNSNSSADTDTDINTDALKDINTDALNKANGKEDIDTNDTEINTIEKRDTGTAETSLAIDVLRHYSGEGNEPLGLLNQYYQKKGIQMIQSYFVETFVTGTRSFYYSFVCPLTNIEYRSGIPRPLFQHHHHQQQQEDTQQDIQQDTQQVQQTQQPNEKQDDDGSNYVTVTSTDESNVNDRANDNSNSRTLVLIELATQLFGTYLITPNGDQVSFGTKKKAKKALAMAVLQKIKPIIAPDNNNHQSHHLIVSSIHNPETVIIQPAHHNRNASEHDTTHNNDTNNEGDHPTNETNNNNATRNERVPLWCHKLYDLGVSTLNISYEEHVHETHPNDTTTTPRPELWNASPTQIHCVMETTTSNNSRTMTVVGQPSPSKTHARDNAASAMVDRLVERNAAADTSIVVVPVHERNRIPFPDSEYVRYWRPLPLWATSLPMRRSTAAGAAAGTPPIRKLYLYRLTFLPPDDDDDDDDNDGEGQRHHHTFLQRRMGLQHLTPMGVLFPHDDLPEPAHSPDHKSFRAQFPIVPRGKRRSEGTLTVELTKVPPSAPTAADLDDGQIASLQNFNTRLCRWHLDYSAGGIRRMTASEEGDGGNRVGRGDDPCGRTYLFVPLVRLPSEDDDDDDDRCGDGGAEYAIDFDLVERVVTDDVRPFMEDRSFALVCTWWCRCITVWIASSCLLVLLVALLAHICESIGGGGVCGGYERLVSMSVTLAVDTLYSFVTSNSNGFQGGTLLTLCLSIATTYFHFRPLIRPSIPPEVLANRFFIEEGKSSGQMDIHVLSLSPSYIHDHKNKNNGTNKSGDCDWYWNHGTTGRSRYSDQLPATLSKMERAVHTAKFNIDLTVASYIDVYRKKFKVTLRYPHSRLVQSSRVTKHGDRDLLFRRAARHGDNGGGGGGSGSATNRTSAEGDGVCYLFPEMIRVLPLPRDFVYVFSQASRFMPPLERAIQLQYTAATFRTTIASRATFQLMEHPLAPPPTPTPAPSPPSTTALREKHNNTHHRPPIHHPQHQTLTDLLSAATKPGPAMQRLEFLGDTVLGYLVGLNEFALNSSLTWDVVDLRHIHTRAIQNTTLADAGRTAGLGRIYAPETVYWRSAYCDDETGVGGPNALKIDRDGKGLPFPGGRVTFRLEDKMLSDMVEALLAACYLYGRSSYGALDGGGGGGGSGGRIVLGLMEALDLPMPRCGSSKEEGGETTMSLWSCAKSSCIDRGYAFDLDFNWSGAIDRMAESFGAADDRVFAKVRDGRGGLIEVLGAVSSMDPGVLERTLECDRAKLLLHCALYDDSHANEQGLVDCALFRDILHRVGHESLQLIISQEIFQRYPSANERDMTVQRLSAMSSDIVVYIMFKAGIQRFLFDQSTTSLVKFQTCMEDADIRGTTLWSERGGWILGLEEFYKRFTASTEPPARGVVEEGDTSSDDGVSRPYQPRYMGIGGGRLLGQHRIDDCITGDLSFSMKSIVGALVLAMGLDGMWCCIGPLWEEALLLSAEEIRQQFGGPTSAVMNYWKTDD